MTDATGVPGFAERWATVKGTRLRYFVAGSGVPIVLVHGLGGSAANWADLASSLARSFRVLAPDLPGHGGSSPLPAVPNLNPFADRLAALLELEAMTPAVCVGHSLGGVIALRLSVRHPPLVQGLVLASSAGISSGTRRARYAIGMLGIVRPGRYLAPFAEEIATRPLLRRLIFKWWGASDPASLSAASAKGFVAATRLHTDTLDAGFALARDDPRQDLHRVEAPCLVICGARDLMIPMTDNVEYARRLRAPLRLIPDTGHLLIGERPDALLDAITGFVGGLSSPQVSSSRASGAA
ncbi:MAG: alpha/beta fold hydrolase [Actinomycetota bacterium]|nr:alpha/beta fold hydrolase [Actinomycetota bacterium]